jgi:osmoprotectant transport system ATP-binding protein
LVLNPSYLLLDEPMGALDPMIRADLQKDLKAICQGLKMTVVCVTHDLSEAAFLGDKVVLMQGGKVSQEGALSQLMQNPRNDFVVKFLAAQHPFHWTTRP